MSEVKAEETPLVVEAPKVEGGPALVEAPAPVVDEAAAAPAETTETAAEAKEDVKEEEAKAEPAEVKTITEGWLEFKPHGLLHFISTRRYFYLQDEPIEFDNLQTYLKKEKKEKPEAAHSTAAYASQTGKGLLFFAKTDAQKNHPIGIIKLADVVEVTPSGTNKFALKLTNDVWNFESLTAADRDSWVHTIKGKVAEAKDGAEAVTSSEGYMAMLEKFSKKSVAAKAETAKEKEEKKEEKKEEEEEKEEKKEEKKENEKEKKDKKKDKKDKKEEGAKSDDSSDSSSSEDEGSSDKKGKKTKRSNSVKGKRTSIFDILGGKNKRHEKEEKKEEKVEEKKEEETKTEEQKPEVTGESSTEVPVGPVVEEEKPADEAKPVEETTKNVESPAAEGVTTPKGSNKRHSFFSLFDKKKEAEKKDVVEPIKEREAVSDTPPVIAPIGEEPKEAEIEEAKPIEAAAPAASAAVDSAKTPSSPPKESFLDKFGLFKSKEKAPAVVSSPEPEVKKEDVVETKPEDVEAPKEGEAVKESGEKAADATSPKDAKRRSSFFSLGKKDKKPADVKSDTEEEPSSKSNPTSPLPKKLNLFRKNSKSAKDAPKAESEEVPPVPEVAPAAVETPAPVTTEAPAPVEETPVVTETTTAAAPTTTV